MLTGQCLATSERQVFVSHAVAEEEPEPALARHDALQHQAQVVPMQEVDVG